MTTDSSSAQPLLASLQARTATAGIVGLGYVGLPLAAAAARSAFRTIGFDIDPSKPGPLNAGKSHIAAVRDDELSKLVREGRFVATGDFARLSECDVIVICVPTPLTKFRDPDLSFIENTCETIARHLRRGQLVVLESTTYPGTTREVMKPILETSGLSAGSDFFIGFSPEREDPGNANFETATIPKVVAGDGREAGELVQAFYGAFLQKIVPVSSPDVAEAVKITENVFRAVNIALVNELKVIYSAMGIDVWEVIEGAKTKPFGFMPFYPGPGLGGHCIPIDPFYLSWKARAFDVTARFIELAGEINVSMPHYVVESLCHALSDRQQRALNGARVLVIGLAYKKNVPDVRESPTFKLMELMEERGAQVAFHDPFVPEVPMTREHAHYANWISVPVTAETLAQYDAVLISTDHDSVDYALIANNARLVIDTRNVMEKRGLSGQNVVKS
ncbi:MAG: nucleotide sugar dehydrogenase [Alphaproteobacteria bacterium]|nr:nucleotide sugar dehydrogenase [Alphaproteobacteria bacterium]